MDRVVRFKLTGKYADWAGAFEDHCSNELGIRKDLSDLVKGQFIQFLINNSPDIQALEGERNEPELGNDPGNIVPNEDQSTRADSSTEERPAGADPTGP